MLPVNLPNHTSTLGDPDPKMAKVTREIVRVVFDFIRLTNLLESMVRFQQKGGVGLLNESDYF